MTAWTLGWLDHYTPEHRKFLASGYVCQQCGRTLLTKYLIADVKCYGPAGNVVPIMQARRKGKYFECPQCLYRWILRTPWREKPKVTEPGASPNGEPGGYSPNSVFPKGPTSVS
jgi:DNA-directed RNA polymerase subunit RPC12/RpoP